MKSRSANFDLLRIVATFMVIMMHFLWHGNVLSECKYGTLSYYFFWGIRAAVYPCVNCFVLLGGYFNCDKKIRISKIVELEIQTLFYSILGFSIALFIGSISINFKTLRETILPFSSESYWYVTCYIILLLIAPILNIAINNMKKSELQVVICLLFVVYSVVPMLTVWPTNHFSMGRDVPWFIELYLIAGYIKRFGISTRIRTATGIYVGAVILLILSSFVIGILTNLVLGRATLTELLYVNNSPLVLLESLALFLGFKQVEIQENVGRIISKIAQCSFGAYLLHENVLLRNIIWNSLDPNRFLGANNGVLLTVIYMLVATLIIFVCGSIIESIRKIIMSHVGIKKISIIVDRAVDHYIER